jgi:hypothetical protein
MAIDRITYEEAKDIPLVKSNAWFFGRIHPDVKREVIKGMGQLWSVLRTRTPESD